MRDSSKHGEEERALLSLKGGLGVDMKSRERELKIERREERWNDGKGEVNRSQKKADGKAG